MYEFVVLGLDHSAGLQRRAMVDRIARGCFPTIDHSGWSATRCRRSRTACSLWHLFAFCEPVFRCRPRDRMAGVGWVNDAARQIQVKMRKSRIEHIESVVLGELSNLEPC